MKTPEKSCWPAAADSPASAENWWHPLSPSPTLSETYTTYSLIKPFLWFELKYNTTVRLYCQFLCLTCQHWLSLWIMGVGWKPKPYIQSQNIHLHRFSLGLQNEDSDALLVTILVHYYEGIGQTGCWNIQRPNVSPSVWTSVFVSTLLSVLITHGLVHPQWKFLDYEIIT